MCGELHDRGTRVFWVQCDDCQSWYNVAERCIGMSVEETGKLQRWCCWACEVPASSNVEGSPARKEGSSDTLNSQNPHKELTNDANDSGGDEKISFQFVHGDMVYVREHAWPGVDNPGGIAQVLEAYEDEDEDVLYDIKYIVGGKKKGVLEEYLSPHQF